MVLVHSFDEVRAYISNIRSLRKGFITNFFPEQRKIEIWLSHNRLFVEVADGVVLFFNVDDGFVHIFYCAINKDILIEKLASLPNDKAYVLDQIVDYRTDPLLLESFTNNGYEVRKSLIRMNKVNFSTENVVIKDTFNASNEDIPIIDSMLHTHFDRYSEQLPTIEELKAFLHLNHIIVCKKKGVIAGFILYDQNPSTLHLRYWLVNPDFRNQGIGSLIFNEYNRRGASCKRHILWVAESNFNAIKRYEHYGYKNENIKNYVMSKNLNLMPNSRGGV